MTRGYFTKEKNGKVEKAAYLPSDAYLDKVGYGHDILAAFSKGGELELLDKLSKESDIKNIEGIEPWWYRNGKTRMVFRTDYAYVLVGNKLKAYNHGKLLFCTKREDAETWLKVCENMERFIDTYVYSKDSLSYDWKKKIPMFRMISQKIEEGISFEEMEKDLVSEDFIPCFLKILPLMDVSYTDDHPAYVRTWTKDGKSVTFIAFDNYGEWKILVQLPFIRAYFLCAYTSRSKADIALLDFCKENEAALESFYEVTDYYEQLKKQGSFDPAKVRAALEEREKEKPWLLHSTSFSIDKILENL